MFIRYSTNMVGRYWVVWEMKETDNESPCNKKRH